MDVLVVISAGSIPKLEPARPVDLIVDMKWRKKMGKWKYGESPLNEKKPPEDIVFEMDRKYADLLENPDTREHMFEQLLKIKNNLEEYQNKGEPDMFDPTSNTNIIVWFAISVAFVTMVMVFI